MPSGIVYWRFLGGKEYRFGYATRTRHQSLVRMGIYNGDISVGPIVDISEIEWKQIF